MLNYLLNLISPPVIIIVWPDNFHFQRKKINKIFATKLYISLDDKIPRVVGVGSNLKSSAANKCIDLFKINNGDQDNMPKIEALEAFIKHAFADLMRTPKIIRPKVIIRGASSLENCLCGYQQVILKIAIMECGARECVFED